MIQTTICKAGGAVTFVSITTYSVVLEMFLYICLGTGGKRQYCFFNNLMFTYILSYAQMNYSQCIPKVITLSN